MTHLPYRAAGELSNAGSAAAPWWKGSCSSCNSHSSSDQSATLFGCRASSWAAEDPAKAGLVKLRFFTGLTMPEIAQVKKISLATAERHWTYARAWLYAELKNP